MIESLQSIPRQGIALITLHAGYHHSSLALRSIAAFCRKEPFFSDMGIREGLIKSSNESLFEELVQARPKLVGFSTYLWNIQPILRLARNLKQLVPETRIVLGGPEAGPRGEDLLRSETWLDYVIDGEGEMAFRDLSRWCLFSEGSPERISGLVWRDTSGLPRRNAIKILDPAQWVSPYGCGLGALDKPLVYWETSRGCPYRCTFCTSSTDRLRTAPLERVDADLAVFRKLENKTIKLLDRSFHLGAQRTLQLLRRFLDTPESLRFHLELNPDRVSDEALELFAAAPAGKFQFEIGLQTLSGEVLDRIERVMDVPRGLERIRQLVALRKHPVHLDLIVGLPDEDSDSCRHSLDVVFALQADHLQLGILKLLPGTPLREQAHKFGYRWDSEPPYEILCHERLTHAELTRYKRYAELLERLWNNGLVRSAMTWLVDHHFAAQVSRLFDHLLDGPAHHLASERMQPDQAFDVLIGSLEEALASDPVLAQLLLWDYAHFSLVTGKTPVWIAERLRASERLMRHFGNRRMPVLDLGAQAVDAINRHRVQPLLPGRYAVWTQRDRKGRPVEVLPIDAA